jgi:hypothetical protein
MPIPKKPNKRRHKKTKHVMTAEETQRHLRELHLQRHNQSLAIQKQITDNAGDILDEIPELTRDLTRWVKHGKIKQGSAHIASANRTIEWILHDTISHVPEVWIRAPDQGSSIREHTSDDDGRG